MKSISTGIGRLALEPRDVSWSGGDACGLKPAAVVLAAVPGLLAGSACCAPILFVLLGVQVTASLITLMGLLVPAAFTFLLLGLGLTLRFAARRCAATPA